MHRPKKRNSISLKFNYKINNKNGLGTKAILYNSGKKQLKQLFSSRGFISSVEQKIHFGLDSLTEIDSISIIWPDNTFQKIKSPEINKTLSIDYKENNPVYYYPKNNVSGKIFKTANSIDFKHKEDFYYDFNREKIIPYQVSKLGPAFAIGDIDGNGFDDIYLGGSSGNVAELYLNNGKSFKKSVQKQFENDANYYHTQSKAY